MGWIWYGVFDRGQLVDCTPGENHAAVVAADLTKATKRKHTSGPVRVEVVQRPPEAAAAAAAAAAAEAA